VFRKGCQGFLGAKMHNGEIVLFGAVLNLYVRIKIRVATFVTNHSVTDIAASIQKLPEYAKSVSTVRHRQLMCQT
jgi:hypothetical protein